MRKLSNIRAITFGGASLLAMMACSAADAQQAAPSTTPNTTSGTQLATEVVVVGQRKALRSAQDIKKNSTELVDSLTATDIGALPDRSVTEALQRIPGVTIGRTDQPRDVDRLDDEGSGVQIRGLSWVRTELNGGDSFGARNGRGLDFEDVTPELMAGVDVYKNPSAEIVEGGLGGTINLRTWMPFDNKGQKFAFSVDGTQGDLAGKTTPSGSALYSNRFDTNIGQFGFLIDLAHSELKTRVDELEVDPYDAHNSDCQATNVSAPLAPTDPGYAACTTGSPYKGPNAVAGFANSTVMVPTGVEFRQINRDKTRDGAFIALQYKPTNDLELYATYFRSQSQEITHSSFLQTSACCSSTTNGSFVNTPAPGTSWNINGQGNFVSGDIWDGIDQGFLFNIGTNYTKQWTQNNDMSTGFKWASNHWTVAGGIQYVQAESKQNDNTAYNAVIAPQLDLDVSGSLPKINIDSGGAMENPSNYFWYAFMDDRQHNSARQFAAHLDATYEFDNEWIQSFRFGVRATDRHAITRDSGYNWQLLSATWSAPTPALVSEFSKNQELVTFKNFMHGSASAPSSLWLPTPGLASNVFSAYGFFTGNNANPGYVAPAGTLNAQNGTSSIDGVSYTWASGFWSPFNGNYANGSPSGGAGVNTQIEQTDAGYVDMHFGHDNTFGLNLPFDGNVGVRVVNTDENAVGYIAYPLLMANETTAENPLSEIPASEMTFANGMRVTTKPSSSYLNVLPSLNLRFKFKPNLFLRFAASQSIVRPDFYQLQPTFTLSGGVTNYATTTAQNVVINNVPTTVPAGTQEPGSIAYSFYAGNPNLKPLRSNQYDVSLEYYPEPWTLIAADLFYKDVFDYIENAPSEISLTNNGITRTAVGEIPENFGHGTIKGAEFQARGFLDFLPGALAGIGADTNLTIVDSEGQSNSSGSPYDAQQIAGTHEKLPLEQLSKYNYNVAFLYSKYGIDMRLAYNWRSRYLMTASASNLIAPVFAESYGQLDGSLLFTLNKNFKAGVQAANLIDSRIVEDIDERNNSFYGTTGNFSSSLVYKHNWADSDRRISIVLRGTF
jgi:TonB-dependent receptor